MSDNYISVIEQFADWLDGHEISPPPRPETMQALRAAVCELRIQQARRESDLEDND